MNRDERLAHTAACYALYIEQLRQHPDVAGLQLMPGERPCTKALSVAGFYPISQLPTVPPPDCDSEFGCTCWWHVVFTDELT